MQLDNYLKSRRRLVDRYLDSCLPPSLGHAGLVEAMRYSLFAGGKRFRPILAVAAAETLGGTLDLVLPYAGAIEMIHTYSLIHDDLPAMDDDKLRRGRPTNHIVFGEALAILAGDALLTEAFRIMAEAALAHPRRLRTTMRAMQEIAAASGARGMIAGQAADMAAESEASVNLPTVEYIHVRKTGELIRASVRAGALLSGAGRSQLKHLTLFSEYLGLAFQVIDDILDEAGSPSDTGKASGRDRERRKATFPAAIGLGAARQRASELIESALLELNVFGRNAEPLRRIARRILDRAGT